MMFGSLIGWCFSWTSVFCLLIIFGIFAKKCFMIVPSGRTYVMESFGVYTRTLRGGWYFVSPFESPHHFKWSWPNSEDSRKMSRKTRAWIPSHETLVDPPQIRVRTSEGYLCEIDVLFYFQVVNAELAAYKHADPLRAMYTISQGCLRDLASQTDFETMSKRQKEFAKALCETVNEEAAAFGINVCRVVIERMVLDENIQTELRRGQASEKAIQMKTRQEQGAHELLMAKARNEAVLYSERRERTMAAAKLETQVQETRYAMMTRHNIDINMVIQAEAYQNAMRSIASMPHVSTLIVGGGVGGIPPSMHMHVGESVAALQDTVA